MSYLQLILLLNSMQPTVGGAQDSTRLRALSIEPYSSRHSSSAKPENRKINEIIVLASGTEELRYHKDV